MMMPICVLSAVANPASRSGNDFPPHYFHRSRALINGCCMGAAWALHQGGGICCVIDECMFWAVTEWLDTEWHVEWGNGRMGLWALGWLNELMIKWMCVSGVQNDRLRSLINVSYSISDTYVLLNVSLYIVRSFYDKNINNTVVIYHTKLGNETTIKMQYVMRLVCPSSREHLKRNRRCITLGTLMTSSVITDAKSVDSNFVDFVHPMSPSEHCFVNCGPFYKHGLTLIPTWISNHMHYKVWDEITYPFLKFSGATVEV